MGLLPSLDLDLPDCSGLIEAGERLMNTVSDELPPLMQALVRYLDHKAGYDA